MRRPRSDLTSPSASASPASFRAMATRPGSWSKAPIARSTRRSSRDATAASRLASRPPRRPAQAGYGGLDAIPLQGVAIDLDAEAGRLRQLQPAVALPERPVHQMLAEGMRGAVVLEHRLVRVQRR